MSRRIVLALVALGVLLLGGAAAYNYMFATTTSYANYTAPTFEAGATDEQNIFQLQSDLGNAAAEMAQLQDMATKLQFGKMKAMGRHLQEVAAELEPRLAEIEDPQAKKLLAQGIEGLRMVGEGSEELDRDKSMQGVNQVLGSFEQLNNR
jgi:peptidoglycan hydrolase CwlO-like protein